MVAKIKTLWNLFWYIQKSNIKKAFISKTDAFINIFMMILNNLSFIFMWWVIFNKQNTVNGWNFDDMLFLFAIFNNAFAFFALFSRGVEELPYYINNGNLDNYLLSPQSPLFAIATSRSTFANWGDFLTGIIMFMASSYANWSNFWLMLAFSFLGYIVIFSFRLILSSLSFFAKDMDRFSHNIFLSFLTFCGQPASIFIDFYKVMILTIIPAGFISYFPIELIKSFSLATLATYLGGCITFYILAVKIFYLGLKKYGSGNRFGIR